MRDLFARARLGVQLQPFERAFLKLVQSFLTTGALAVLPLLVQLEQSLTVGGKIDWLAEGKLLGMAFLVAVAHALVKYFRAHVDPTAPVPSPASGLPDPPPALPGAADAL